MSAGRCAFGRVMESLTDTMRVEAPGVASADAARVAARMSDTDTLETPDSGTYE